MPPFPTEQVLDIQSDRTLTNARLQTSVDLQDAAAVRKIIMDWDEPATADRIVKFPDPGRDAEVAYKHDVATGIWKEALLSSSQLDSANDGIQSAVIFYLTGLPINNETVVIENDTDGAETFTWKTTATLPFEVQIGGSAAASLANLASQITTDSSYWAAAVHTDLAAIATDVVLIRKLIPDDGDNDRLYGTTTAGQIVDFGTVPNDLDYRNTTLVALPSSDPGSRNFGISRATATLEPGEQHLVLAEDEQYAWDADATQWNQIGIVVPIATSASGGGTIGKWTADSDKGLAIAAGVGEVKVNTSLGMDVDASSLKVKPDTANGIDVAAAGIKTRVDGTKGMAVNATGHATKVDGVTMTHDPSGNLATLHQVGRLALVSGVDGKAVAVTSLYTVPAGKTAIIFDVVLVPTTATAITAPPTAGVGIAAGEDDIFASQILTGLLAVGNAWRFPSGGKFQIATAGQIVKLGIDTGATGTTLTLDAHVIGLVF